MTLLDSFYLDIVCDFVVATNKSHTIIYFVLHNTYTPFQSNVAASGLGPELDAFREHFSAFGIRGQKQDAFLCVFPVRERISINSRLRQGLL